MRGSGLVCGYFVEGRVEHENDNGGGDDAAIYGESMAIVVTAERVVRKVH